MSAAQTEDEERAALELLVRERSDVWWEGFTKIRDINGQSIQPVSNILQRRIDAVYQAAKRKGKTCRMLGLKPRKKGFSTKVGGIGYSQLCNHSHEGVIVGNKQETAVTVYNMVKHYAENDAFYGWYRPTEILTELMRWDYKASAEDDTDGHNAIMQLRTAMGDGTARGMTPQFIHGTEVAHWKRAKEALLALMNAIPDQGFNCVVLESTPNGAVGEFYDHWKDGRWPAGDECPEGEEQYWRKWDKLADDPGESASVSQQYEFVRVFAAWYEFEEARIPLTEEEREQIRATIDAEPGYEGEQEVIDAYGVDEEQLAWRRMIIKTKCQGNPRLFDQEYPKDPESCFLASGSQVFSAEGLKRLEDMAAGSNSTRGCLNWNPNKTGVVFTPDKNGWLEVWEQPREGFYYAMSGDPASGESQTDGDDPDAHSVCVGRASWIHGDRVANPILAARIVPPTRVDFDIIGEQTELLCHYYGRCIIIPEINNYGGGEYLAQLKMRKLPIYMRKTYNPNNEKPTLHEGWQTTPGNRKELLSGLVSAVRDGQIDILCRHAVKQFKTFVQKPNGRWEHANGEHDDDVFATALWYHALPLATEYKVKRAIDPGLAKLLGRDRNNETW